VEPSHIAKAFCHTDVRVASLAPIDYNSVKYKNKLQEPYLLLLQCILPYSNMLGWFSITPSKSDGDGGTRDFQNKQNELCPSKANISSPSQRNVLHFM